jgi:hypothetical protein
VDTWNYFSFSIKNKSIVNGTQKVVDALKAGNVKFEGNIQDLENFVALFDSLFVYKDEAKPN